MKAAAKISPKYFSGNDVPLKPVRFSNLEVLQPNKLCITIFVVASAKANTGCMKTIPFERIYTCIYVHV